MAAALLLNGPSPNLPFIGKLNIGQFSSNVQHGRYQFVGTGTTCTVPLYSGGLTGTPEVYTTLYEQDKTLIPSVSGSTLTLTRSSSASSSTFDLLVVFSS